MKIKVAICTTDICYSEKITHYFQTHYYDRFIWDVVTEESFLIDYFNTNDADIVLIGEEIKIAIDEIRSKENDEKIWAYLVEDIQKETSADIHKIAKYSRADKIYRDLLELYSHKTNVRYRNAAIVNDKTEIYAFVSAAGGTGTSTVAVAMAQNYAKLEKVLYINLENIGASSLVFHGEGKAGFEEIIFALKSRRKALSIKLASMVSRDNSGVYFFEESKNGLDVMELVQNDLKELLMVIQSMGEYDKVILDVGNSLGEKDISALIYAGKVVVVIENSDISDIKLEKYIQSLRVIENQKKADICTKMILFYNKVFRQTALPEQKCGVRVAGSYPKIENGTYAGVIERLSELEVSHNVK